MPDETVEDYFLAADLAVLPYVSATQSGIVQIAYNYDLPVVTTDVGGLPEVVRDGETGFIVPPADPAALAAAIARFFDEERAAEFGAAVAVPKAQVLLGPHGRGHRGPGRAGGAMKRAYSLAELLTAPGRGPDRARWTTRTGATWADAFTPVDEISTAMGGTKLLVRWPLPGPRPPGLGPGRGAGAGSARRAAAGRRAGGAGPDRRPPGGLRTHVGRLRRLQGGLLQLTGSRCT